MAAQLIEETLGNPRLLPRIMFIACGSFSPPTPMHFRMFEIARDHFEMLGTHKVVGGIVSPTHDAYGKKGLAAANHRSAMLKLALQSSHWIRVSDWETNQPQWSRTQAVLQHHQNYMNNFINSKGLNNNNNSSDEILPDWLPPGLGTRRDPVQLKLLCGADLLESFAVPGLWADADIEDIVANHGLVVISRSGANPEKFIFDSDILTKHQRNITLVTNWVPNEVSSTMIRRLLGRGQSVKYLIDELVLDYIKRNSLFNYNSEYITDLLFQQRPRVLDNFHNMPADLRASYNNNNTHTNKPDKQNSVASSTGSTPLSDGGDADADDDADADEERMDETDYSIKSLLTSINLDNRKAVKVFCCGDQTNTVLAKLLPQKGVMAPGQAVQVITNEKGRAPVDDDGEHLRANTKKLKMAAAQDV